MVLVSYTAVALLLLVLLLLPTELLLRFLGNSATSVNHRHQIPSSVVLYSWLLLPPGSRSCYCTSRLVSASDDPPSAFFSCSSNSSHDNTARSTTCSAPQPVFPTRFHTARFLGHSFAPVYSPHSSAPVNSLHTVPACHSGSFGPAIAPTVVIGDQEDVVRAPWDSFSARASSILVRRTFFSVCEPARDH